MTNAQRRAIDSMTEDQMRKQSSALNRKDHREIMDYIDKKLDGLNVGEAMVVLSEGDKA